ncbi:histone-lysine N-methyltransferase EHMT2 isoform X2 [Leptopilina heterotoma]|uniref:histone-lysine N-methyltransferase EHMT2 isoform X2 n=1 Tax=Leptopilina heterotoma TaxID=63436 RepID=UPI001CA9BFA2|nr:histone-lysine N-methyltransferase EHMT2 isoform X2 [Leptopilina heterotoma]
MCDSKCDDSALEGCQDGESEVEDTLERTSEDNVSIQQILQEMTNEFNRGVSPKQTFEKDCPNKELPSPEDFEVILKDDGKMGKATKTTKLAKVPNQLPKDVSEKSGQESKDILKTSEGNNEVKENQDAKEAFKKDSNIPRIVLTFRTIDENTDSGKKTKISSCSSNLALVPDELANCTQIGGVSVKIETSEEYLDSADKSDTEEAKVEGEIKVVNKDLDNDKTEVEEVEEGAQSELLVDSDEVPLEKTDESRDVSLSEPVAEKELETNSTFIKKQRKRRLRITSDVVEGAPSPKRSARRMCKEPLKSTVLESAIARKEKSNYTEEHLQFKPIRKYNKPGRPKKILPTKEVAKQINSKVAEADNESDNNTVEGNNSINEVNMSQDASKNWSANESSTSDLTINDSQYSGTDFDEMPKLSPILKNTDSAQIKSGNSTKTAITDDAATMSDNDKPFLKPAIGKTKRERGRPKGSLGARKIAKSDSFEGSTESGKYHDCSEEDGSPAKRTRRSVAASPSSTETQGSKPDSALISSETHRKSMMCLCQVRSQLYVTVSDNSTPLYCTAIDSIDGKKVGCCNEVDVNDVNMRRPSTCVPFIILCRMHKERLFRHNCCPMCGLFCSQGKFIQCVNGHQYHRDCEMYLSKQAACPHCGCESPEFDIVISLNGLRVPIYIPTRRKFSTLPSAKMTLPGKGDNTKLAERPPSPLIQPEMIKIPEPTVSSSDRPERYTIMSLYTSVKNGDLEKLVNVLTCGYNANHTFRDYASRTSVHLAAEKGHLSCLHVLIQAGGQVDVMDKNQLTPLMLAASKGRAEVVRYLIRIGADTTLKGIDGMTALHIAAKSGHLYVCRIILSECKVPRTLIDCVDDGGWTSLIWACEFRHTAVARFLIEQKCDPLIRDAEQNIALHWSAFSGSSEITELLLNEGCDVNAVNVHGDTPLHIAARQDQYAVSILLLARGAKVVEVNSAGETAINCCSADGDTLAALRLNAKVNELSEHMWEKTVKILCNDISRGKETNPVQCVNGLDSEDKPTDFLYVTENCFTSNINIDRTITSLQSCRCENNCSSEKCLCGTISLRCWYDEEGKLLPEFNYADPPMLFECNPSCDCNKITCNNRVVQHGMTQRFQLFRTKEKGWGLRTLKHIPKGTYVCEYVGEIISDSEADHREDDSYLFDLDNRVNIIDGETYCIDARRYGNVARFINHSCAPNLLPVRLFVEHQDLHFPRIAFFANRNIEADEELGFDYGEKFWIIKCKSFTCTCGAETCRYSKKTIQVTLDNYRRRIQQEEMHNAQTSS